MFCAILYVVQCISGTRLPTYALGIPCAATAFPHAVPSPTSTARPSDSHLYLPVLLFASLFICCPALCKPPLTGQLDGHSCEQAIFAAVCANTASTAHHGVSLLCSSAPARALEPAAVERMLCAALSAQVGDALKGYYSHMLVLPLIALPGVGQRVRKAPCSKAEPCISWMLSAC
jgi:hypothetical protein